MSTNNAEKLVLPLRTDEDVVRLRQSVREALISIGFSLIDQTKMVTAASELARNTLRYGGGGESHILKVTNGGRRGLSLSFIDHGPGIPDVALALKDGYTTGGGLGLGLSGAKRLSDEFEIITAPGEGTTVSITKWKPF
ncbi:anti-sigma regulatory factor [Herbaspirillum sp. GCM10030257]|uniref:anti-sigma regulatory factor n=1 Tax=Herbaspirillum sp. GCM10030257 TaxID=3273393 RepID=UPI0036121FBA